MEEHEKEQTEFRATTIEKLEHIESDIVIINERISKRDSKIDSVVTDVKAIKWLIGALAAIGAAVGAFITFGG